MLLPHNLISTDIVRYIHIPGECLLQLQSDCTHINKPAKCGTDMLQIILNWRVLGTTGAFQHSFRVHNFNKHFVRRLAFTSVYKSKNTPYSMHSTHIFTQYVCACARAHTHTHTQTPVMLNCSTVTGIQGKRIWNTRNPLLAYGLLSITLDDSETKAIYDILLSGKTKQQVSYI